MIDADESMRASRARTHVLATVATYSDDDIRRLDALLRLGRPGQAVAGLPPLVIAQGDNWGGRMPMPGEGTAAAVDHAWRCVSNDAGVPLPCPYNLTVGK